MGKTVLVTGVNGFVGQHLARKLKDADCTVVGMTHKEEIPGDLRPFVDQHIMCDLTDKSALSKITFGPTIDAVINLAGIAINDPSVKENDSLAKLNVAVHTNL